MCGIGAIVVLRRAAGGVERLCARSAAEVIPQAWVDGLELAVAHRGPDGRGVFRDRAVVGDFVLDVALVHRRLAILDVAGGEQPMRAEASDGLPAAALVFNGCVYNHRELRREMEGLGERFVSDHSDTEVLLRAWRRWGDGVWGKVEGMYAAGMWGGGAMWLARDRFGEKPLALRVVRREVAGEERVECWVSSCAGALVRGPGLSVEEGVRTDKSVTGEVPQAGYGWARWGFGEEMPGTGVRLLEPGERLDVVGMLRRMLAGEVQRTARPRGVMTRSRSLSVQEIDEAIGRAVGARLDADVPLGCFLSGGVDSSIVTAHARRHRGDITAFTVKMPDATMDESDVARRTASRLGVKHEVLECQASAAEDLVKLIEQIGTPLGDSSLLATYWLCKAAREQGGIKVALSGDGGDELFGGYERHSAAAWLRGARRVRWLLSTLVPGTAVVADLVGGRIAGKGMRFMRAAAGEGYADLLSIWPSEMMRRLCRSVGVDAGSVMWEDFQSVSDVAEALAVDQRWYLPCDLSAKMDTASMSVALEVRAPLLDSAVVDLANTATIESLMPGGQRKGLLREVARRHGLEEVAALRKRGFAIPIGRWLREDFGGLGSLARDVWSDVDGWPADLIGVEIDRSYARAVLDEHMTGQRDHGQRIYSLMVLGIWCRWRRGGGGVRMGPLETGRGK